MATTFPQLGQVRENSTNPITVYSPAGSTNTVIRNITICNTSGAAATFRLFLDADGTTYNESTALKWDVAIAANASWDQDTFLSMNNSAGNLAYRSSVSNALTITVSGVEVS